MGDVSQCFQIDFLSAQWIFIVVAFSQNFDLFILLTTKLKFNSLTLSKGFDNFSGESKRIPSFGLFQVLPVRNSVINNHLKRGCVGAINQIHEKQGILHLKLGIHSPTRDCHNLIDILLIVLGQVSEPYVLSYQMNRIILL